ncbi:hypothetical protein EGH24_04905 [Halonotius terrestris]|uniref:Uncharacterized protein n=1 Tax=Halonotius terrestris TaxID=2487750 RepID=A0A8J8PCQ4_9EURY|nr:hypothetical protein [Halonotius terrestris]TQQ82782.1 hypothetical protein EGH24_04905 [Halonotius terrestris]
MDIPRPAVPSERLAGWAETESTVEEAFSTPVVTVHTHTVVYEEAEERGRIHQQTGLDFPWRFFFSSRIRLQPARNPSKVLTSLIRRKATDAFTDRLATRGFQQVSERHREETTIGGADGLRVEYRGVIRHEIESTSDTEGSDGTGGDARGLLTLPVAAVLAVWNADDDYHVAGGGYPAGPPDSGPNELTEYLSKTFDSAAAREKLDALIDGCGPSS